MAKRNPLARFWTDRATIVHNAKFEDEDGISQYDEKSGQTDVPCTVSWNVKVPRTDSTIVQRTDMEARIFFPLGTDVGPGDIVYLTRNRGGVVTEYVFQEISIPMYYSKHIEVNCKEQKKRA